MHRPLPFPARKMKCILTLAEGEGAGGGRLWEKMAGDDCAPTALCAETQATACVFLAFAVSTCQSPQHRDIW